MSLHFYSNLVPTVLWKAGATNVLARVKMKSKRLQFAESTYTIWPIIKSRGIIISIRVPRWLSNISVEPVRGNPIRWIGMYDVHVAYFPKSKTWPRITPVQFLLHIQTWSSFQHAMHTYSTLLNRNQTLLNYRHVTGPANERRVKLDTCCHNANWLTMHNLDTVGWQQIASNQKCPKLNHGAFSLWTHTQ